MHITYRKQVLIKNNQLFKHKNMVIDFSISNFRSIRDKQTLSFEATNSTHLEEYFVMKVGKYRLLKIATLLGANASGKSNVLRAFYLFTDLMLRPCKDKTSEIE